MSAPIEKTDQQLLQEWFTELRMVHRGSLDKNDKLARVSSIGLALIAELDMRQGYINQLLQDIETLKASLPNTEYPNPGKGSFPAPPNYTIN